MAASEKAKQLLQIITSLGIRQWLVLPLGVTNCPSYFQEMMFNSYGGEKSDSHEAQTKLLGPSMIILDALFEVWIDDVQLGPRPIRREGSLSMSRQLHECSNVQAWRTFASN